MQVYNQMTMSFSKGKKSETSIKHNNREFSETDWQKKGHQHIKREYTKLNKILVKENIRDAYKDLFQNSVDEYNKNQKRKDRRIADYYSKIKKSNKSRTQYEFVVQIGAQKDYINDKNRITSKKWQNSEEILEKYFEEFQKAHKNLHVYNAVIHMDEEGAPHLHMNLIPVGTGYKRGLKSRVSFDKALEVEGYPKDKKDSRKLFKAFREQEVDRLANIAHEYGIERVEGKTNRLKDVHEYKQAMREAESLVPKLESEFDKAVEEKVAERTKHLEQELIAQKAENQRLKQILTGVQRTLNLMTKKFAEAAVEQKNNILRWFGTLNASPSVGIKLKAEDFGIDDEQDKQIYEQSRSARVRQIKSRYRGMGR